MTDSASENPAECGNQDKVESPEHEEKLSAQKVVVAPDGGSPALVKVEEKGGIESRTGRFNREIRDAVDLMEYAIQSGRALDDKIIEKIKKAESWLQQSVEWPPDSDRAEFEKTYRDLAMFMKPVTIGTLRATQDGYQGASRSWFTRTIFAPRSSDSKLFSRKLWSWVVLTSILIVLFQTLSTAYGVDEETNGSQWMLLIIFGRPLVPFLYGLLGALTYLLRSAHSYITDRTFDLSRAPEYYNRMLLGFTSGGIVLLFVDPKSFGITDSAIAFIVGYNTDYLFDMIERLANGIFPKVNLTVTPKDAASKPGIAKVQVAIKELEPGARGNGTVVLTTPAPSEGVVVALSADHAVTVPQTVTVQSGSTSAQFTIGVPSDGVEGPVSITASANGTSASDSIQILPALAVQSVTLQKGNNEFTATVTLNREALTGDAKVGVSIEPASFGTLPKPPEVVVPKGQKQADLKVLLNAGSVGPVRFTAMLGRSTKDGQTSF